MSKKKDRDYWYTYFDINCLLKAKSQGNVYEVIDSTSNDYLQTLQRVNAAFTVLNNPNSPNVVALPINFGISNQGTWQGSHWVGLVIKKVDSTYKAFYTDSLSIPMENCFPTSDEMTFCSLKQILINHGVTENNIVESNFNLPAQQSNDYDCGPWTVFNLDSLAKTEKLANVSDHEIVAQRNSLLPDPLELLLEEQSGKVSAAMKNEPIYSYTINSDNMLRRLPKNLASLNEEDKEISKLIKGNEQLGYTPSLNTFFVINTIAYVPEHEFTCDSPTEELDGTFSNAEFNFDPKNVKSFPFTTTHVKHARGERRKIDFEELSNSIQSNSKGTMITSFLKKLSQNGFEKYDKNKLTHVSASIALNRMKSLSARKNKSMELVLKSKVETDIRYEIFAFFWVRKWFNKKGQLVEQKLVTKFYKQLKKVNPTKAQEFIRKMEENINVPYQELREFAKNHSKTKKLVQEFRNKDPDANIYFSLIDSDTVDFNGVYSAYLRIVKNFNVPTVMCTGYEYSKDEPAYQFLSQIDREVRVITASHIPLGVYYPEPNMCVLIERGCNTLQESFIDEKIKRGNNESACLLKKIQYRKNATFIFSRDNPLITAIPDRAKASNSAMSFSSEFVQGASPTKNDMKCGKNIPQSSFHEFKWLLTLFLNDSIQFRTYLFISYDPKIVEFCNELLISARSKESEAMHSAIDNLKQLIPSYVVEAMISKYTLQKCKRLISAIRKESKSLALINELKAYITPNVVDLIVKAIREVEQCIAKYKINYIRNGDEDILIGIFKRDNIKLSSFSKDELKMLAQQPVLELIERKIINPQNFIGLQREVFEYICYDEEILGMLEYQIIDFESLLSLLNNNFSDYMAIINLGKYSILDIFDKYNEDPLHLKFMANEPSMAVYLNSDDKEIVKFGKEHYYDDIDVQWIRCELNSGRENVTANVLFDINWGVFENTCEESSQSDYEDMIDDEKWE